MITQYSKFKLFLFVLCTFCSSVLFAQQEKFSSSSRVGVSAGTLSYNGRYSVGAPFMSYTSWAGSVFYIPDINLIKNLHLKAELMAGQMKGDNNDIQTTAQQGNFSTNIVELSAKAEYDFLDLRSHKFSPYVATGPGFYKLLNYKSSIGSKESANTMGFVLPVAAGLKYNVSPRLQLLLDGNVRFFNKNLDNYSTQNNPNKYFTIGLGLSYKLQKQNILW